MSDLVAHGSFTGRASADLHSLARAIAHGGNRRRHAHHTRRQWNVPDEWFERLTDQSVRFASAGKLQDLRVIPAPAKELPTNAVQPELPDVPVNLLDEPLVLDGTAAKPVTTFGWGGGLFSLIAHAGIAALLLTVGLTVEMPQVEGETAVAVTIIGNGEFNEMASGDAEGPAQAEPTPQTLPAGPDATEPEPDLPPFEPFRTQPLFAPELARPALAVLASPTPAKTSIAEQPDRPKPAEAKPTASPAPEAPIAKVKAAPEPKLRSENKPKPVAKVEKKSEKTEAVQKKKQAATPAKVPAKSTAKSKQTEKSGKSNIKSANKQGTGKTDARKGTADGADKGTASAKSTGKSAGKTGNASASNYPGLVQRKIARTRKKSGSGKGNVVISFSITASGGLGSVSVARSSGTPAVDAAALDHVRRSAPFPAPPAGAQTRFQIPVTIR